MPVHPALAPGDRLSPVLNGTTNQCDHPTSITYTLRTGTPRSYVVVGDVENGGSAGPRGARQWGDAAGGETFVALPEEPEQVARRKRSARWHRRGLRLRSLPGRRHALATATCTHWIWRPISLGEGESSRLVRAVGNTRQSSSPPGRRGQQYAALCARLLRRHAPAASRRPGRKASAEIVPSGSTGSAMRRSARPNWPRPKEQKAAPKLSSQRQTGQPQAGEPRQAIWPRATRLFDIAPIPRRIQAVTGGGDPRAVMRGSTFVPTRNEPRGHRPRPAAGAKAVARVERRADAGTVRLVRLPNGLRVARETRAEPARW